MVFLISERSEAKLRVKKSNSKQFDAKLRFGERTRNWSLCPQELNEKYHLLIYFWFIIFLDTVRVF
jgi:hypothetical protein